MLTYMHLLTSNTFPLEVPVQILHMFILLGQYILAITVSCSLQYMFTLRNCLHCLTEANSRQQPKDLLKPSVCT
jgi:hypothetical protein